MINVFQILIINIIYVYQSLHKSREIMTYFETYFDSLCHHTYKHTARKSLQKAIVEKVPIYWLQLPSQAAPLLVRPLATALASLRARRGGGGGAGIEVSSVGLAEQDHRPPEGALLTCVRGECVGRCDGERFLYYYVAR